MSATFTPGGVPNSARLSRFASTRLLHEWSLLQPWEFPPTYELRLGPTPLSATAGVLTPAIEAMLRTSNLYADLVGVMPHEIQVVEAKMRFDPGAISQVETYVNLLHTTPVMRAYPGRQVIGVILVAFDNAVLRQMAGARGIRVVLFTPTWAEQWLVKKYSAGKTVNMQEPQDSSSGSSE